MKYLYDLHIHSALSPCAEDNMTPLSIVADSSCKGLEIIAIADHNAIENVKMAMLFASQLDIIVVPAMELQTNEDLHLLCLFAKYEDLERFYAAIPFSTFKNDPEVFGNQLVFNDDDEVVATVERMLATSCLLSEVQAKTLADDCFGVAVPAHIDRESNGMLSVLGGVPSYYTAVEIRDAITPELSPYVFGRSVVFNSDAHCLEQIGICQRSIELKQKSAQAVVDFLKGI